MANLAINTETQTAPENINDPETLETPDNENPQINMNTATNVYPHLPHISLRDTADTVPSFNGRNIPLHQFIKSCRHARRMVNPNAEYGLVQLIKNKLYGQASRVILSGEYNTIGDLISVLSSRFAPLHTSIQLYGELSKIAQFPNETTIDYSSRVSNLLLQIRHCNTIEVPGHEPQFNINAEQNAVKAFLTGLKIEIYNRIRECAYTSLDRAINNAIKAEAEYNEYQTRTRLATGITQNNQCTNCFGYGHDVTNCSSQQVSCADWRQKTCQYCKKIGHTIQECRNLNKNQSDTFCDFCRRPGHMTQDCRSRSYTNRTPQSNEYCSNCRRPGHTTQDCRSQANRAPQSNEYCSNCRRTGHTTQDCRNQSYTNRVSQPNTYCDYCRRPGHTIQECRSQAYANISCEYCKFRGHTIEQCRKKMYFDKKEKEGNKETT